MYVAFFQLKDDLVPSRRRFRILFIAPVTAYMSIMSVFLSYLSLAYMPPAEFPEYPVFYIVYNSFGLVLTAVLAAWFFGPARAAGVFDNSFVSAEPEELEPSPDQDARSAADIGTEGKILQAMGKDELFRVQGLTIGMMSKELELPEHVVRRVINRKMGFRNFSSFVNGYRIEAAKDNLASLPAGEASVLEVAFNVGYQSLAPFNRAFKEATGMTPSRYRYSANSE